MTVKELLKDIEKLKELGYITDDYRVDMFDWDSGRSMALKNICPNGETLQLTSESNKESKEYAEELWEHRNDKYGHEIERGNELWTLGKGSDLIELNAENLPMDEIYPYEPNAYYLDKDGIYVYKVGSVNDIINVLEDRGDEFFEFC